MSAKVSPILEAKVRKGKTAKDKKSGAWGRRFVNLQTRASWSNGDTKLFPDSACNGKGNSSKAHKGIKGSKVK